MNEPTLMSNRKLLLLIAVMAVAALAPIIIAIAGGDNQDTPGDAVAEPTASAGDTTPIDTFDQAKPSTSLQAPPECMPADGQVVDTLLGTLEADGGDVELSAMFGEDATALMVRSAEGTIDYPHLVWVKVGDTWQAATRSTQEASTSPAASAEIMAGSEVSGAIACLTAGSR